MSYKGPQPIDNRAANVGCLAALGVALFPTTFCTGCWVHTLHFVFALLLFSIFIFFSIYLFRKTNPDKKMTTEKKYRNRVYLICGIIMILCILGIAVSFYLLEDSVSKQYHLVYWFESLALVSFGISWITKSESFYLRDKKRKSGT
jgi:L-asparagine transporter-like permease